MNKFISLIVILALFAVPLISHGQQIRAGGESSDFTLAVKLYNDGMYDLARAQFQHFIESYPQSQLSVDARFYLGLTLLALHRYGEARTTFQTFAMTYQDHPKAPEAWWNVGECYALEKNYREAATAFERLTVFYPKSSRAPEALVTAARYFIAVKDTDDAKQSLRTVLQSYISSPQVVTARMKLAEIMASEGNLAAAKAELSRIINTTSDPEQKLEAQLTLVSVLEQAGELDQATALISALSKQTNAKIALTSALLALSLGDAESAAAQFLIASSDIHPSKEVSHKLQPEAANASIKSAAMFGLGVAHFKLHRYTEAASDFERFERTYPESDSNFTARWYRAQSLTQLRRFNEALAALEPLVESKDTSLMKLKALAFSSRIARAAGQPRRAAELMEQLVEYSQLFSQSTPLTKEWEQEALLLLGLLYKDDLHNPRQAVATFSRLGGIASHSASPRHWRTDDALFLTAQTIAEEGDAQSALNFIDELLQKFPASELAQASLSLRDSLQRYSMKQSDHAVEALAELMRQFLSGTSKDQVLFELGMIQYRELKDFQKSASTFNEVLRSTSDPALREKALVQKAKASFYASAQNRLSLPLRQAALAAINSALALTIEKEKSELQLMQLQLLLFSAESMEKQALTETIPPITGEAVDTSLAFTTARNVLSSTSASDSAKAAAASLAGRLALHLNQPAGAASWFTQALSYAANDQRPILEGLLAQSLLLAGKIDTAQVVLSDIARRKAANPATPAALWNLARIKFNNGQFKDALSNLRTIEESYSYTSYADSARALLPEVLLRAGKTSDAITFITHELTEIDADPFAEDEARLPLLIALAESYEAAGRFLDAQRTYRQAIILDPRGEKAAWLYQRFASVEKRTGNTHTAIWSLRHSAELAGSTSGSITVTEQAANLLFLQGADSEAIQLYTTLLKMVASAEKAKEYKAKIIIATYRMGNIPEADRLRREFISTYKSNLDETQFAYERAVALFRQQRYDDAKKAFESFIDEYSKSPLVPWASYWIGKTEEATGQLDRAKKRFQKIVKEFPSSDVVPRVYLSLGNIDFRAEKYEDAVRFYRSIIDSLLMPPTAVNADTAIVPYAMSNLIEAYKDLGMSDAALDYTRRFIQLFPNDPSIPDRRVDVGILYERLGYYDQALLHFQNLLEEASPELEAEIRYYIGECYFYKADYERAILEFLKVPYLATRPTKIDWRANAFYMAGQSYEKMGKYNDAIKMYQEIINRPGIDATFKAGAQKEIDRVRTLIPGGK
ncbi:MAG: tetratricopeptide repeat protein [Bacteroidota bacterium]